MINLDPSKLNQLADIMFCVGTILGFSLFIVLIYNVISINKNIKKQIKYMEKQNKIINILFSRKYRRIK